MELGLNKCGCTMVTPKSPKLCFLACLDRQFWVFFSYYVSVEKGKGFFLVVKEETRISKKKKEDKKNKMKNHQLFPKV